MGNVGLLSILKSTWDWQTNKQTSLKITRPVGRRCDGRTVSQGWSSDHIVAFLCHEPPFMWDKLTHCWRAQCLQHLFSNSKCIVFVIYSPFFWTVIQLTHTMVNLLRCCVHIWEAMLQLGCWWTLEDCWKCLCDQTTHLRLAYVWPPLSIQQSACVGMSICVCWAWGTLMESNVCVMLGSPKRNGVGVGGDCVLPLQWVSCALAVRVMTCLNGSLCTHKSHYTFSFTFTNALDIWTHL